MTLCLQGCPLKAQEKGPEPPGSPHAPTAACLRLAPVHALVSSAGHELTGTEKGELGGFVSRVADGLLLALGDMLRDVLRDLPRSSGAIHSSMGFGLAGSGEQVRLKPEAVWGESVQPQGWVGDPADVGGATA